MRSSKKTPRRQSPKQAKRTRHAAFWPFLILCFIFWFVYRGMLQLPVLFDELIGKAIFFGLPVWLYVLVSGFRDITDTFAGYKLKRGLMVGVAIGGLYGFVASLMAVVQKGSVTPSFAFLADGFWWEFFLALLTGFWETLFFFSFVMLVVRQVLRQWSFLSQVLVVVLVFLLFHLPNIFLRFQGPQAWYQIGLLSLLAFGQALIFSREKNGYTLTLSQAFWGLALLLNF